MRAGSPAPPGPAFNDAELAAAWARADALWTAESGRERDRLLALPPASRLAALDDDATRMLLRPEHRAEVRASLAPAGQPDRHEQENRAMQWTIERRRLAVLHTARPVTVAACVVAALVPFAVAAWRDRMGLFEALAAFLTPGPGLAGVALALLAAGLLGRWVGRMGSLEGLAGLVVAAFMAGVAGLAVSRGVVF
jgi:hypothetical protein